MEKKALGKGLEALFEGGPAVAGPSETVEIEVGRIIPNRYQPRADFDEAGLRELTESIRRTGILQPVLLRRRQDGQFELIAGERRWRAAQAAGLEKIPAMFREATDDDLLAFALIENIQRQDLNPIEAARAYRRLMKDFQMTQEAIASRVGKDRSSIANALRLLSLPHEAQKLIREGRLSTGHAKALLGLGRSADQTQLARRIVGKGLSVRQAERWVRHLGNSGTRKGTRARRPAGVPEVEDRLRRYLATSVKIAPAPKGGKLVIEYFDVSDLDRIVDLILSK
jgi:ParB family transcriptional regulator, chromosome partitioning protein